MIHGLYDGKLPNGGNPDGIFLTSGKIMQSRYIRNGKFYRLYIAHPIRQKGVDRCGTFVIYSDDFGHTWHVLGTPSKAPSIAQDESKVEKHENPFQTEVFDEKSSAADEVKEELTDYLLNLNPLPSFEALEKNA